MYKFITENITPVTEEIDFRQAVTDFETPKNRKEIKAGLKQKILKVAKAGGVIIFNMDDSSCKYTSKYDPDYKEFYDRGAIHQHIWDPEKLLQKEVWGQYSGSETMPTMPYTIVVWSKERIDGKEDDPTILEKIERRFGKTVPLEYLNLLFCTSLADSNDTKNGSPTKKQ